MVTTQAKRGNIYDRNQVELAREGVASSVGLVPGKLPEDRDGAIAQLSELLEISTEKIEKALSAGWVRDDTFVPLRTVAKDAMELKETAAGNSGCDDFGHEGAVLSLWRKGSPAHRLCTEYYGGRTGKKNRAGV